MLRTLPIGTQFVLVSQAPFFHDGGSLAGQAALADFARFNGYQGFKALVFHMNMRWRMVVMPHTDDDAKKTERMGMVAVFLRLGKPVWTIVELKKV